MRGRGERSERARTSLASTGVRGNSEFLCCQRFYCCDISQFQCYQEERFAFQSRPQLQRRFIISMLSAFQFIILMLSTYHDRALIINFDIFLLNCRVTQINGMSVKIFDIVANPWVAGPWVAGPWVADPWGPHPRVPFSWVSTRSF